MPSSWAPALTPVTDEYSSTASSRLARGPTATIAATERSGWVIERQVALVRIHRGLTLVQHADTTPNGNRPMTNSVSEPCPSR